MSKMFSPLKLNAKTVIKNRLAVAPMTTQQSNPDGTISIGEAAWLERLSEDGYGLIISCASAISKKSIAFHNQLSLAEDKMIDGLSQLAKKMKGHNSISIIQLFDWCLC